MTPEAWVALGALLFTIVTATVALVAQLSSAKTEFKLIGKQQAVEISEIKVILEKLEGGYHAVAVDRERMSFLEKRTDDRFKNHADQLAGLRRDFEDFRRGKGMIG